MRARKRLRLVGVGLFLLLLGAAAADGGSPGWVWASLGFAGLVFLLVYHITTTLQEAAWSEEELRKWTK